MTRDLSIPSNPAAAAASSSVPLLPLPPAPRSPSSRRRSSSAPSRRRHAVNSLAAAAAAATCCSLGRAGPSGGAELLLFNLPELRRGERSRRRRLEPAAIPPRPLPAPQAPRPLRSPGAISAPGRAAGAGGAARDGPAQRCRPLRVPAAPGPSAPLGLVNLLKRLPADPDLFRSLPGYFQQIFLKIFRFRRQLSLQKAEACDFVFVLLVSKRRSPACRCAGLEQPEVW